MSRIFLELAVLLLLMAANAILSMAEMAILSARRARLEVRAEDGSRGARIALQLAEMPTQFISTIQVGITLISILTGSLATATLSQFLGAWLGQFAILSPFANTLAIVLVVITVTYFSLVLGELVPKRLAINHAEDISVRLAPLMQQLARLIHPLVAATSASTDFILRLVSGNQTEEDVVTDEEVRQLMVQGAEEGVFEQIEEEIVGQVFRLSDRTVSALITPRTDVVWLDLTSSPEEIRDKLIEHRFDQFPVAAGDLDQVVGVALTKDLLAQSLSGQPLHLPSVLRQPLFIPESTPALEVVEKLKGTSTAIAFVIDEYGGLEGMVTLDDIVAAIIGELPDADRPQTQEIVQREDGSYLLDGMFAIDEFKDRFDLDELPDEAEGYYQTLGGFMMRMLEKVPATGDKFEYEGLRLEVIDMDGRRVDKVLIERMPLEVAA